MIEHPNPVIGMLIIWFIISIGVCIYLEIKQHKNRKKWY